MQRLFLGLLLISTSLMAKTGPDFDQYFVNKTMRVDYYFTGIKGETTISLDQIKEEPVWAGSMTNLIDTLNYGNHKVEIFDINTNTLIFSKGFSSLFQEWQTTDEAAAGIYRTISASVLIPFPKKPIKFVHYSRNSNGAFEAEFETEIDPDSRFIRRDKPQFNYKVKSYINNGSPSEKVDILLLPEGYTKKELRKFRDDVKHFMTVLFDAPPFNEYKDRFNVWYLEVPSEESGIDNPRTGVFVKSAFELSYNSFDSDRYVLAFDNKRIRDIAANAPYDQLYFIVNSDKYGGGGIYNLYSTCYSHDAKEENAWWPDYVFVHEFGHAFGGLADEYYTSQVAYNEFYPLDVEPWEPNVTPNTDPETIKWKSFIDADTPVPTPWEKQLFDNIPYKNQDERYQLLRKQEYWGKVGAYEGSGYVSEGQYRPYLDCKMFSKSLVNFCPVCQNSIVRVIKFYTEE
ncbi:MAG: M64 family metallopeptidase [bacterium]